MCQPTIPKSSSGTAGKHREKDELCIESVRGEQQIQIHTGDQNLSPGNIGYLKRNRKDQCFSFKIHRCCGSFSWPIKNMVRHISY